MIYNGRVLHRLEGQQGSAGSGYMSSRGQQGCPLMMPMFCAMKKEMRDRVVGILDVDFVADFADDGVMGGEWDKVLRALMGEIALGAEYGLRHNFSKMVLYPLAGEGLAKLREGSWMAFAVLGSRSIIRVM